MSTTGRALEDVTGVLKDRVIFDKVNVHRHESPVDLASLLDKLLSLLTRCTLREPSLIVCLLRARRCRLCAECCEFLTAERRA